MYFFQHAQILVIKKVNTLTYNLYSRICEKINITLYKTFVEIKLNLFQGRYIRVKLYLQKSGIRLKRSKKENKEKTKNK